MTRTIEFSKLLRGNTIALIDSQLRRKVHYTFWFSLVQDKTPRISGSEMTTEEMGMTLPEELVVKILSMVPFPYVSKARALS